MKVRTIVIVFVAAIITTACGDTYNLKPERTAQMNSSQERQVYGLLAEISGKTFLSDNQNEILEVYKTSSTNNIGFYIYYKTIGERGVWGANVQYDLNRKALVFYNDTFGWIAHVNEAGDVISDNEKITLKKSVNGVQWWEKNWNELTPARAASIKKSAELAKASNSSSSESESAFVSIMKGLTEPTEPGTTDYIVSESKRTREYYKNLEKSASQTGSSSQANSSTSTSTSAANAANSSDKEIMASNNASILTTSNREPSAKTGVTQYFLMMGIEATYNNANARCFSEVITIPTPSNNTEFQSIAFKDRETFMAKCAKVTATGLEWYKTRSTPSESSVSIIHDRGNPIDVESIHGDAFRTGVMVDIR